MIPWRVIFRRSWGAIALAAVVACAAPACKNAGPPRAPSANPVDGPAAAEAHAPPALVIVDAVGKRVAFRVEVARTPAEHERGLMYRKHLDPDAGMIFLFDRPFVQTFWMKNTLIPLDMVFISSDREIVGIVANAEPETETVRRVDDPSQFVLEVAGGVAAERGLRVGQRVEFRGFGP
jgi:uncharacterized membrane protein (UPF0127 family)